MNTITVPGQMTLAESVAVMRRRQLSKAPRVQTRLNFEAAKAER